jgi:hypothetical protein
MDGPVGLTQSASVRAMALQSRDGPHLLHFRYTTRNGTVTGILLRKVFQRQANRRVWRDTVLFDGTLGHDAVLPCSAEGRRP